MSSAALRTTDDEALDQREQLRVAILGHEGATAQVATMEQAIARGWEALTKTDAALEKADEELDKAKQADIKTLSIATRKGEIVEPSAVRAAREHKISLEDRLVIERGSLNELKRELVELRRQEAFAEAAIIAARNRLVEPLLASVSADYLDASARAMVASATMSAMVGVLDEPPRGYRNLEGFDAHKVREFLQASHTDINEVVRSARSAPDFDETKKQIHDHVRGALVALLTDADAELPQI